MKQELQLSKDRTEQELRQDEARMKHELNTRLRDERIRAYSHLLTVTASIKMDKSERTAGMVKVAEAYSEIQLLTDSKEVIDAASYIGHNYNRAAQSGANAIAKDDDPSTSIGYRVARKALEAAVSQFLDAAKEELGVKPHASDLSSSTDDEADRDTR